MSNQIRMIKPKGRDPRSALASSFVFRHSFVIRHSCFVLTRHACVYRRNDRRFLCANFSADKNELRLRRVKRFQLPPAGDEVEELSAIGEADEAFRSNHIRGKAVCEGSETGARK